jgi:hypothetical protein
MNEFKNYRFAGCLVLSMLFAFVTVIFVPVVFFDAHANFGTLYLILSSFFAPVVAIVVFRVFIKRIKTNRLGK